MTQIELVLSPISAVMGRITRLASVYTPYIGWDECSTGVDGTLLSRGYLSYDTSVIPAKARILSVWFYVRRRTGDPIGMPEEYGLQLCIGTFVGNALDGTGAEWLAGTGVILLYAKPADGALFNLAADGVNPIPLINRSGITDLKLRDLSNMGEGDPTWGTNFNRSATELCQLIIYYEIVAGTATGVGSATCSASLTSVGAGTATGSGLATCAASVTAAGAGHATGSGYATCVAAVTAQASASATGVGSSTCAAMVITHASGTATGIGYAACTAMAVRLPRGEASGRGYATCICCARHVPLAQRSVTRRVSTTYEATRTCDPAVVRTRGARRD